MTVQMCAFLVEIIHNPEVLRWCHVSKSLESVIPHVHMTDAGLVRSQRLLGPSEVCACLRLFFNLLLLFTFHPSQEMCRKYFGLLEYIKILLQMTWELTRARVQVFFLEVLKKKEAISRLWLGHSGTLVLLLMSQLWMYLLEFLLQAAWPTISLWVAIAARVKSLLLSFVAL